MSTEAKKLKAHIGKIKEYFDGIPSTDDDCDDEKLPETCFKLLLITELCQRGVAMPLEDVLNSPEKLFENIQNSAGKVLLDETRVPKPLVAGSAAIGSMVAEKLADILLSFSRSNLPRRIEFLSDEESQPLLRRCQEVGDPRFEMLLNLGRQSFVENNCNGLTTASGIDSFQVVAILLFRLAIGNIFRAASFSNPDQPPMWKKSLDLCTKFHATLLRLQSSEIDEGTKSDELYLSYHISDAIFPLSNLIRIMEAKNNRKRVSELSLRLAEAYISNEDNAQNRLFSDKCCAVWNQININFINSFVQNAIGLDRSKKIFNGRNVLKKFDSSSIESSTDAMKLTLLYQLLNARIEMEHENYLIQHLSMIRCEAAKNRKGTPVGNQQTNTMFYIDEVRIGILTKSLPKEETEQTVDEGYDGFAFDKASTALLDTILSLDPSDIKDRISHDMQDAIYDLIKIQIERLLKRAQGFSIIRRSKEKTKKEKSKIPTEDDVWKAVVSFLRPILNSYKARDRGANLSARMKMLNVASKSALVVAWMKKDEHLPIDFLESATKVLSDCEKAMQKIEFEKKKDEAENSRRNIIRTSGTVTDDSEKVATDWSLWTGHCHMLLTNLSVESKDTSKECESITLKSDYFIKLTESSPSTTHVQYGMPYLMFLVCWSGFHRAPWPFCNVTRAREIVHLARESLRSCKLEWGRDITEMEETMLNLGEADAECGFLSGGMTEKAKKLYEQILLSKHLVDMQGLRSLLHSHCLSGLVMIALSQNSNDSEVLKGLYTKAIRDAKSSLENLTLLQKTENIPSFFHKWRSPNAFRSALNFRLCQMRTLVAESLIRAEKATEAEVFLKQAVIDSPSNFDAAFALGGFWLRMSFYTNKASPNNELAKRAHFQLLKALKLNSTKADPFSLLGIWYEIQNDLKRALGCYSKALLIDPSHPVAGRGIIRLRHKNDTLRICEEGASVSSNTNGWAWRALGDSKAYSDGLDEKAIICYQQALRSRDIESPKQHSLGIFFFPPSNQSINESSQTWSTLACCYRRLGKYSASLRAYESAFTAESTNEYFCAWAQVELELGLLDDAALKFKQVLKDTESMSIRYSASYGLASCMLLTANQNIGEGKYGAALRNIKKGIACLSPFMEDHRASFLCMSKLMGDLHSNGYRIPPSVFAESNQDDAKGEKSAREKIEFLEQGETIYHRMLQKIENDTATFNDDTVLTATLNDIGINILLQARLESELHKEGSGLESTRIADIPKIDEKIESLLDKSKFFSLRAIKSNQLHPLSWCGLGCTLSPLDMMLAQHAFCRALQLDKNCTEAWVNLSLIYADQGELVASEETIDALTQVADTPLMWIARGLLLERRASRGIRSEEMLQSSSDAYRACLQTSRDSSALLGLALTCRRLGLDKIESDCSSYKAIAEDIASKESHSILSIFLDSSGGNNPVAEILHSTMEIEQRGEAKSDMEIFVHEAISSFGTSGGTKGDVGNFSAPEARKDALDIARQNVLKNPDDGESWLALAKQFILAFTKTQKPSKQSYELVCDTTERAKYILKTAVTQPPSLSPVNISSNTNKNMVSQSVKASTLSEAYALSSWVQYRDVRKCSHDHQRSLMLDPENCVARDILH